MNVATSFFCLALNLLYCPHLVGILLLSILSLSGNSTSSLNFWRLELELLLADSSCFLFGHPNGRFGGALGIGLSFQACGKASSLDLNLTINLSMAKSNTQRITLKIHTYHNQCPVVQSVVSLTSSLRVISLIVLADSIYSIPIFFAEKNVSSFCTAKATHIFSAKNFRIFVYHLM